MLAALLAGPATCAELAERIGVGPSGAGKLVTALRARGNTLVRVAGWQEQADGVRGNPAAIYALGDGRPDAPRPAAVSRVERNRAYRLRDPERFKRLKAAAHQRRKTERPEAYSIAKKKANKRLTERRKKQRRMARERLAPLVADLLHCSK